MSSPAAETPTIRYCEDCRFCKVPETGFNYARCENPNAIKVNTGDQYVARELNKPPFASGQRLMEKQCGPGAAWFEARPALAVVA